MDYGYVVCELHVIIITMKPYRFRKAGISVISVIDTRRRKKNGMYPVKIEVVYRRIQKYYPTDVDVSIDEWESFAEIKRPTEKMLDIGDSFYRVRDEVVRLLDNGTFSFETLAMSLGRSSMTLNAMLEEKMEAMMRKGQVNSFYRYQSTLSAVERFAGKHVQLAEVDVRWLERCEAFLTSEGKSTTTMNIYMTSIRCVMREAVDCGLIKEGRFPFRHGGYRLPAVKTRKLALTKDEIRKIREWHGCAETEYWRDLWMFSYLCNGINFRDMLFLKYGDVVDDEIIFIRSKTSRSRGNPKAIRVPVTPYMCEIMERCGNGRHGRDEQYIFKHARGGEKPMEVSMLVRKAVQQCNEAAKKITEDTGVRKFSTYSARHSFATILKRGGADISFISESLGHTNLRVTETYLDGWDKEARLKYAETLL